MPSRDIELEARNDKGTILAEITLQPYESFQVTSISCYEPYDTVHVTCYRTTDGAAAIGGTIRQVDEQPAATDGTVRIDRVSSGFGDGGPGVPALVIGKITTVQ